MQILVSVTGMESLEECAKQIADVRPVLAAGAAEARKCWIERFRYLDLQGNQSGFPEQHFWTKEGADNVLQPVISEGSAEVICDSFMIAHKETGGTVTAKDAKNIAIAQTAEASAALRPKLFGAPLRFIPMRNKGHLMGLLVEAWFTKLAWTKKGLRGGHTNDATRGKLQYMLFDQVTHKPMGDAVYPDQDELESRVQGKMDSAYQRLAMR